MMEYCNAVLSLVAQLSPTLYSPMDCSLPDSSIHGNSPGKNPGVDYHALLQGIFLSPGSSPCLLGFLHWHAGSLPLVPPRKPHTNQCHSANVKRAS